MQAEINEEVRKRVREYFRQSGILFGSFLAGLLLFLATAYLVVYYQGPLNPEYYTFLTYAAPASGLGLVLMAHRLSMGRIREARKTERLFQKMEGYRSALVLRMILLDGAAFVQLISYVMIENKLLLVICLVLLTLFMLYRPTLSRFIKEMELSELETRVIEDHYHAV